MLQIGKAATSFIACRKIQETLYIQNCVTVYTASTAHPTTATSQAAERDQTWKFLCVINCCKIAFRFSVTYVRNATDAGNRDPGNHTVIHRTTN